MNTTEFMRYTLLFGAALVVISVVLKFKRQQRRLRHAGVDVEFVDLCGMRARHTYRPEIFSAAIRLAQGANEAHRLHDLEAHYLADGRVEQLVELYLTLKHSGVSDAWRKAAAMDLMGKHSVPQRSALAMANEKLDELTRK